MGTGHDQNTEGRFSRQADIICMCAQVLLLLVDKNAVRKMSLRLRQGKKESKNILHKGGVLCGTQRDPSDTHCLKQVHLNANKQFYSNFTVL